MKKRAFTRNEVQNAQSMIEMGLQGKQKLQLEIEELEKSKQKIFEEVNETQYRH